jgi:hypothetical protein
MVPPIQQGYTQFSLDLLDRLADRGLVNTTLAAWEKPPWRTTSTKVRMARKSISE